MFQTVNWSDTFGLGVSDTPRPVGKSRYNLATALLVIRALEASASRGAVFAEIKNKNPLYRLIDTLYSNAGANVLQPLFLFIYMLKCALSVGPFANGEADAVTIANFPNERHTIDRLVALLKGARIQKLSLSRAHVGQRSQLRAAMRLAGCLPRLWPFLARVARLHSFMPAARIASGLAYYLRFSQAFAENPGLRAAIVASNYSPEALGLAAAAHRSHRRVIYVNHAPVPANSSLVPPVLADCAVFYGDAIRHTYERRSRCSAEVVLIGQPGIARPMDWRSDVRKVGIFLTALTRPDAVAALVGTISAVAPGVDILIRNHPVGLLKSDFADLAARYRNLEITIGNPLDDEIAACDLIFCGNSGVAMNVLRGGRPVAYLDALDAIVFDYNGFVESGLVCEVPGWSDDIYSRLQTFYANPAWRKVMESYDASYDADNAALDQAAAAAIRRYLSPSPGQGQVVSLERSPVPLSCLEPLRNV